MMLIEGSNITIGHLGIVAGMFNQLEIGKYIDEKLPKTRHHHIRHGIFLRGLDYRYDFLVIDTMKMDFYYA